MLLRTEGGVGGEMQDVGHGAQTPVFEACRIGDVADDDLDPLNGRAGGIGAHETPGTLPGDIGWFRLLDKILCMNGGGSPRRS
ncbi:hypothetical protein [Azospirillum brasilense]|uniref:hypothetical protein n=1 Tax=Azospirillum brasilense TaxID=192 RepID=UPI001648DF21|nr:hypothetical protein [Azospirillum brasilense]